MKRLFHYTTASKWLLIAKAEEIQPATAFVPKGEKPAVWFSFRDDWEPTASKMLLEHGVPRRLTFDELQQYETPFRIEVQPIAAPYDWGGFGRMSGVNRRHMKGLEAAAAAVGANPAHWRVSFKPVPLDMGCSVECFIQGVWKDAISQT